MKYIAQESSDGYCNRRKYLRRRMMVHGLQSMPVVDVVELILYYTIPKKDVRSIAEEMVRRFGTIHRMCEASSAERKSVPGIGNSTDEHFAMMGMFIPHLLRNRFGEYPILCDEKTLHEFCASLHIMNEYEVLYLLCLSVNGQLIKPEVKISTGTALYVNAELKHIVDAVANTSTAKVVLCHNHPYGGLLPSPEDVAFTRLTRDYLIHIGITLWDHIITADNSAVSMKEMGYLN